jgi:hypothetical protein
VAGEGSFPHPFLPGRGRRESIPGGVQQLKEGGEGQGGLPEERIAKEILLCPALPSPGQGCPCGQGEEVGRTRVQEVDDLGKKPLPKGGEGRRGMKEGGLALWGQLLGAPQEPQRKAQLRKPEVLHGELGAPQPCFFCFCFWR